MHNYLRTCSLLFLLSVCALAAVSQAQHGVSDIDTEKEAIAEHWSRIRRADSVGDALVAARTRIMLAPLVKPAQARKLYAEAALIADTARLAADEGLRAHQGLMELQRASGNWRGAFEEARSVIALTQEWNERQAQIAEELQRIELEKAVGRQDSLQRALAGQARHAESTVAAEQAVADRWRWTSVLLGLVAIVMLVGIVLAARRDRRRTRTELSALRAELDQVRAALANKPVEATASLAPPPVVPIPVELPVVPVAEGPDDLVLGMFRAQAPGRLEALRQARAIGDHAKVVRVIHTLKPQLVHIDAERFTRLCAALTATGSSDQAAQWNADLDRFEAEVGALLR
ncbi:MAG: Hpt domain-containing protein [Flavobacteriales bacterium]|nr:Hpt domain-containing protein [Flavobacteriales bacterium]